MDIDNQRFLSKVADDLYEKYNDNLSDLCIVMPSHRGIVYLKQYLFKKVERTFISPDYFSVEEFMQKIAGLTLVNREELLILLYHIDKELAVFHKQEFYDFAADAKIVLQDFNDIDLSLAEAEHVFSDLSSIKELSFFGKEEENLSEGQRNYVHFFKSLFPLYERLKSELLNKNSAYQGLMYRCAYEKRQKITQRFPYKKYIFVGFNALQQAEGGIVDYLNKEKIADFYVDADQWYLHDSMQEAGTFLRQLKKDLKSDSWNFVGSYLETIPKKIEILGFSHRNLQALYCAQLLQKLPVNQDETLALVLADESLLLPLLYAIDSSKANITMGLPIRNTQLFKLLHHFFVAIENKSTLQSGSYIYYKDLFVFFASPYMQTILESSSISVNDFLIACNKKGKLYYNQEELKTLCNHFPLPLMDFFMALYDDQPDADKVVKCLSSLLKLIQKTSLTDVDKQITTLLLDSMDYVLSIFRQIDYNIKSYRFLFDFFVSSLSLSFKSNPLSSLQIMGMLETRTLDFDHVILLSVNEGILPAGKSMQSFLPIDVKRHYNIPTYTQGEAIFSYHFFRLLQRAKNVYLLYDLDNQNGNIEKSRFVHQIISEWKTFPNSTINETVISYPKIKPASDNTIKIAKNQDVMQAVKQIHAFSPSMLNHYLECELKFYYHDVLGIRESESISEEIQANVMGSVVHKILENILKDKIIDFKTISDSEMEEIGMRAFLDKKVTNMELKKEDLMFEKNHLIYRITIKFIKEYLALLTVQLQEGLISEIMDFEKKYENRFAFSLDENLQTALLKGIVDRLDNRKGIVTVLDYKTGKIEKNDVNIESVGDLFTGDYSIAFQLMFYTFLYYTTTGQSPINAQIVSFRNLKETLHLQINKDIMLTPSLFDEFAEYLRVLIEQIYNHTLSFSQTTMTERCQKCDYNKLCMRD